MFIPCMIGTGQILIIAFVVLLLFGGAKIPELMRGVGRGVKEFKDAMNTDFSAEEKKKNAASASKTAEPAEPAEPVKPTAAPAEKSESGKE